MDTARDNGRDEALIERLWEMSNHGTDRVDIERAYDAGMLEGRRRTLIEEMQRLTTPPAMTKEEQS